MAPEVKKSLRSRDLTAENLKSVNMKPSFDFFDFGSRSRLSIFIKFCGNVCYNIFCSSGRCGAVCSRLQRVPARLNTCHHPKFGGKIGEYEAIL